MDLKALCASLAVLGGSVTLSACESKSSEANKVEPDKSKADAKANEGGEKKAEMSCAPGACAEGACAGGKEKKKAGEDKGDKKDPKNLAGQAEPGKVAEPGKAAEPGKPAQAGAEAGKEPAPKKDGKS